MLVSSPPHRSYLLVFYFRIFVNLLKYPLQSVRSVGVRDRNLLKLYRATHKKNHLIHHIERHWHKEGQLLSSQTYLLAQKADAVLSREQHYMDFYWRKQIL